jgi:hypothetical protein
LFRVILKVVGVPALIEVVGATVMLLVCCGDCCGGGDEGVDGDPPQAPAAIANTTDSIVLVLTPSQRGLCLAPASGKRIKYSVF